MTGEDDDIPTVDGDTFRDRVGDAGPDVFDFGAVTERSVSDFDMSDVANTTVASHDDRIFEAIESATWHTLIDGAGHEVFPPEYDPKYMREVIHRLETEGFARNEDTAFYAGEQAFDAIRDHLDKVAEDGADDFDFRNHAFDGYGIFESKGAPEGVILFVDPNALFRVPSEVIARQIGPESTPTVSSPVGVRDPAGVAVVNIDLSD